MAVNPLLATLGLSTNDRAVIFHADDIGMCHASLAAYADLIADGLLSSAATMVPCGWFPATAAYCRRHQRTYPHLDMGVHLTFTSEWDTFRWGPISTREASSGLMDDEGYFFRSCDDFQAQAHIDAVQREVKAQLDRAVAAGIDVTHMDTHMGALVPSPFNQVYLGTALRNHLPALMFRPDVLTHKQWGRRVTEATIAQLTDLELAGFPLFDAVAGMPLKTPQDHLDTAKALLDSFPIGVSYFYFHPSTDTTELRAIAPDWESRVADYTLFLNDQWRKTVEESGVHVIGWRTLRDQMRARMS